MSLKVILFDLDGTLLSMDDREFEKQYFDGLSKVLVKQKYDCSKLKKSIIDGIIQMLNNKGKTSNENIFWNTLANNFDEKILEEKPRFDKFYGKKFTEILQNTCEPIPVVPAIVSSLISMGYRVVLATNPLFPAIATKARIKFAGLDPEMFELISTYEDFYHAKPNPAYYKDLLKKLNAKPKECLMIGNNVEEDIYAAEKVGIHVFLINNECLINHQKLDYSKYPQGDIPDIIDHIEELEKKLKR